MRLFLNNIKIKIKKDADTVNTSDFNYIFSTFEHLEPKNWSGDVLLIFPSSVKAREILDQLESGLIKIHSLTIICHQPKQFVKNIFDDFNFIDAGGGIVRNKLGQYLMIYRLGIWDFPKGKLDKGETLAKCAVREVEEECGVKVKGKSLICKTRHTYVGSKKRVLKTTYWYHMELVSDKDMKPQINEGIEKVEWKNENEVKELLKTSFSSLRFVFQKSHGLKGTYAETSLPNL
jgi:8-oxo-(d)GTP phosphatase